MDKKFIDAVQSGKLVRVRLTISNELMLDPRGVTFSEMIQYAETNLSSLYQDDDGKIYDDDQTKWNEDFLYDIKNGLDLNFSKEKLAFYETVAKYVLREKAEQIESAEKEGRSRRTSTSGTNSSNRKFPAVDKKTIYTGVTIGGTALAITGFCVQRLALASLGVVGAVIGGVLLYNETKK